MVSGIYNLKLLNNWGQVVSIKKINYSGGAVIIKIEPGKTLLNGVYHLEVANINAGVKTTKRILVMNE